MFIRYSEANAIKWPKPILYAVKAGGTIPNGNVTSKDPAQILHIDLRFKSKWCVFTTIYVSLNPHESANNKMLIFVR